MSVFRVLAQTFATKGVGLLLTIAMGIVLSRVLQPSGKGAVEVLVMMSTLAILLACPSLEEPQLRHLGRGAPPGTLFTNALLASLGFGAFVCALLEVTFAAWPDLFTYRDRTTGATLAVDRGLLRLLTALAPLTIAQRLFAGLLQGMRSMGLYNVIHLVQTGTAFFLVLALVLFGGAGIRGAIYAHGAATVLAALTSIVLCARHPLVRATARRIDFRRLATLVLDGARLHGGVVAAFVIVQSDQLLLNRYAGPAAVGIYGTAVALTGHLRRVVLQPVKEVLGSRLPEMIGDEPRLLAALEKTCRHTFLLVLVPAILLALVGWLVIRILYGEAFTSAYVPLLILLPGSLFWSLAVVLGYWFIGTNRYGLLTLVGIVVAVTNVATNLWLVPRFGMLATAATSTFAYALHMMGFAFLVSRQGGRPLRAFLWPRRDDLTIYREQWSRLLGKVSVLRRRR